MSKIRKDNYVVTTDGVYGKVLSTAGDTISITTSDGAESQVERENVSKITADEYRQATETAEQNETNEGSSMESEVKAEKKVTKAALARDVYSRMAGQEDIRRKDIIEAMMAEAGLSKAGAATYYYNITKEQKEAE